MKNPGVFSSGVLGYDTVVCYLDPRPPGMLFAVVKPRDQADAWSIADCFNSEHIVCFIISPIIQYLVIVVNH
jgi:hypothetical protein